MSNNNQKIKYIVNSESGELFRKKDNVPPDYTLGVFLYKQEENSRSISGQVPLLFKDSEDLLKYFKTPGGDFDIKTWLDRDLTIVIRPVDVFKQ